MSDQFDNVSVEKKANIYFGGKCVSHAVIFADGSRKTLGLIMPDSPLNASVSVAELMEISSGECEVKLAGESEFKTYGAGTSFHVAENSSFEIHVTDEVNYVCSYA